MDPSLEQQERIKVIYDSFCTLENISGLI